MVQTTRQDSLGMFLREVVFVSIAKSYFSLVQQFAQDLKKKQAVVKIQRWWRSKTRQKMWRNIGTLVVTETNILTLVNSYWSR